MEGACPMRSNAEAKHILAGHRAIATGLVCAASLVTMPATLPAQGVSFIKFAIPIADNYPDGIAAGPDGALWFTEYYGGKIGRVTTSGVVGEYTIPTVASFPLGITAGPDGAMWFCESTHSRIGRISTAGVVGVVTEYTTPTSGSTPFIITSGPDGALWFTEQGGGGKIGRITTFGTVKEYTIPTADSLPMGITTGPDGALWFAEQDRNKIGRITTAGAFSEFTLPTANSGPTIITAGPDGALWFTESSANKIGRITTFGSIVEYPIPTSASQPNGIATGPDAALWFSELGGERIGRITTTGAFTEFTITPAGLPLGIASGPDGAIWFADRTGYIDRLVFSSGNACAYSLPQASLGFTPAGGTGAAAVRAAGPCAWTAASGVAWIAIVSGNSGSGNGTVVYNVAANPSSTARSGTIAIANQTYTVTQAGNGSTLSCTGSAPAAPQVALEGRTELLGDFVLNCSGLSGSLRADVTLTLNTNVTNTLSGIATDSVLTVNGTAGPIGALAGYNAIRWSAVSLLPAGDGTAAVRISRVRADASALSVLGSFQPTAITGQVSVNAAAPVPVFNGTQTLAAAAISLAFVKGAPSPANGGAQTTVPLVLQETAPGLFQAAVTRLRVVLNNLPGTVQVYAPVYPAEGNSRAQLYSADANGLGGSPVAGSPFAGSTYQQLTVSAGRATATWLVLAADPAQAQTWTFPLRLLNASAGDLGQITVAGSLAPVSDVSIASATAPVPRFRDFSTTQKLTNLRLTSSVQGPGTAASVRTTIDAEAAITQAAVVVGSNVTYVSQVLNDTADPAQPATNVVIRDNLPTGLVLINCTASGGGSCSTSGNQVQVSFGTLAPGQSQTFTVMAQVDPSVAGGTVLENPMAASSDEVNLDVLAGTASTSFVVLAGVSGGAPVAVGGTPASGTGSNQTFTFQFSHPSGYQNLDVVNILINNALDGRNACYLAYTVPSPTLYLVNDAGQSGGPFAGSTVPGSSNPVQNSQCAVILMSASGSGTTLTLTLNITFKASFGGNRITYVAARDHGSGNSDWQALGVWQVPWQSPGTIAVTGVTPSRGAAAAGTNQQFRLTLTDTKGPGDFGVVNLLINNSIDGRRACYLAYLPSSNTLILVDDAGDAGGPYAGSMPLNGSSASIENGQCSVSASGSSAGYSGNTTTLTLSITFKGAFAGNRVLYTAGRDRSDGNNTDWQAMGTWTVQ